MNANKAVQKKINRILKKEAPKQNFISRRNKKAFATRTKRNKQLLGLASLKPKRSRAAVAMGASQYMNTEKAGFRKVTVSHREYIGDVVAYGQEFSNTHGLLVYKFNPADPTTFPWLSTMASLYCKYHIKKVKFSYETSCSTFTPGYVACVPDFNVDSKLDLDKASFLNNYKAWRTSAYKSGSFVISPGDVKQFAEYFIREDNADAYDPKTYDCFNLYVLAFDTNDFTGTLGQLFIDYTIDLIQPYVPSPAEIAYNYSKTLQYDYPAEGDPNTDLFFAFTNKTFLGGLPIKLLPAGAVTAQGALEFDKDVFVRFEAYMYGSGFGDVTALNLQVPLTSKIFFISYLNPPAEILNDGTFSFGVDMYMSKGDWLQASLTGATGTLSNVDMWFSLANASNQDPPEATEVLARLPQRRVRPGIHKPKGEDYKHGLDFQTELCTIKTTAIKVAGKKFIRYTITPKKLNPEILLQKLKSIHANLEEKIESAKLALKFNKLELTPKEFIKNSNN
jgi:hypothetical protein